jgi:hypothetical protein
LNGLDLNEAERAKAAFRLKFRDELLGFL